MGFARPLRILGLIIVALGLQSQTVSPVSLDFGPPVVVDQSLGPVALSKIPEDHPFNNYLLASSDNYFLLLVNLPWTSNWSMVRITHSGDLVDTIPRQLRPTAYQLNMYRYGVTWSAPYFYLWEGLNDSVFYTRFTEDLSLVDQSPRYLCPIHKSIAVGGHEAWTFRDYPGGIWAYDAVTDSEMFVGPVGAVGWPSMIGVRMAGLVVDSGAFIYRNNPLDSLTEFVYVSPTREVQVLAPQTGANSPSGGVPYTTDSAVFWKLTSRYGDADFAYYFVSPSDSAGTRNLHIVDLPNLPGRYDSYHSRFAVKGNIGLLIGQYSEDIYKTFAASVDLRSDSLLSFQWLNLDRTLGVASEVCISDGGAIAINKLQNGIEAVPLLDQDFTTIGANRPVLYGNGYSSWPSVLLDSLGLFVYAVNGSERGTGIVGYTWSDPRADNLTSPDKYPLPLLDSGAFFPFLFDYDGGRGFFWRQEPPPDSNYLVPIEVKQHICLYRDVVPSSSDIASAMTLEIAHRNATSEPSVSQVGDRLYFISQASSAFRLKAIDLTADTLLSFVKIIYSDGPAILHKRSDTLIQLGADNNCLNYNCGNILPCCLFRPYLYIQGYLNTIPISRFDITLTNDTYDYPGSFQDCRGAEIDGEYYVAVANAFKLVKVDFATRNLTVVVDLRTLLWPDQPAPSVVRLLQIGDYRAVFFFRRDQGRQEALLFDQNWQLVDHEEIPTEGAVQQVGDIVYSTDSTTLFLAYSSFLPYPYSSKRLVVQPFTLDVITDVGNGNPVPETFKLTQNYPNPFNPLTTIEYDIPRRSRVTLSVYNVLGQRVRTLVDEEQAAGPHTVVWDGTTDVGQKVASGIYLYHLQTGDRVSTRKMMLLK